MLKGEFKKRIEKTKNIWKKWVENHPSAFRALVRNKILEAIMDIEAIIEEAESEFPKIKPSHDMDPVWDFYEWFKKWFGDE